MNLEWVKKHPYATGAAVLAGLVVIFLLFRQSGGSSASGLGSIAASEQSGQLQLASLNSQESSQQDQLNAQLASQEYEAQISEQQNTDQLAGTIASQILPQQIESEFEGPIYQQELSLYGEELNNQASEQSALFPLEEEAQKLSTSSNNNRAAVGENELAILLGEAASYSNRYGSQTYVPTGSSQVQIPFGLPQQIGQGLFA